MFSKYTRVTLFCGEKILWFVHDCYFPVLYVEAFEQPPLFVSAAVMKSEAFRHLEGSCPSLLSELLATFASMDDNSNSLLSRKRSGSGTFGLDLADGTEAESVHPNARRMRRRL